MRELTCEQGSQEWHQARAGIVTGTTLGRAIGTNKVRATLMYEVLAGLMTEPKPCEIGSKAVERGNELEPVALKAAIKTLGINFETTGMIFSDNIPSYGISPDAVDRQGNKIVGGIEMKCPDSKKHIEYLMLKKVPKDYTWQTYAPFLVSDDIQYWYFMSFDDRNYQKPEFYFKVNREDIRQELEDAKVMLISFVTQIKEAHLKLTF